MVDMCATWRSDEVLYGSCTLGIYVYSCKILALGNSKEFSIVQWTYRDSVCCCECFINPNTLKTMEERLRKPQNSSYYMCICAKVTTQKWPIYIPIACTAYTALSLF